MGRFFMKKTLAVIFGGASSEHEVSRVSCAGVLRALDMSKYDVIKLGITKDGKWLKTHASPEMIEDGSWEELVNFPAFITPDTHIRGIVTICGGALEITPVDAAFPVLHGRGGEDGCIQGLFELAGIPYIGAGVAASANCMDKGITKILMHAAGVPQAKWISFYIHEYLQDEKKYIYEIEKLNYPVFVKPSSTGSSVGITKAKNKKELTVAIKTAAGYNDKIIVEEFIKCREIEVAVLGNYFPEASGCGEIAPERDFYDYTAKYRDENSLLYIPARIDAAVTEKVRGLAIKAYRAAGCMGMSRVDFFVDGDKIIFNEINTIPGFTSISMYSKLFAAAGIPYGELLDRLIELAFEKAEKVK